MKPRLSLLVPLALAMAVPLAVATVNDALSFAKEAAAPMPSKDLPSARTRGAAILALRTSRP